jgi:hypothetical protein
MCGAHFQRWERNSPKLMGPIGKKAPRNSALPFLQDKVKTKSKRCVPWPYGTFKGYGVLGYRGTTMLASRVMCLLAHGEPPQPNSQAAHDCGNPICVNPNHIRWDSPAGNAADRSTHGTEQRGEDRPNAKLTDKTIRQILRMTEEGVMQKDIAQHFGVSRALVYGVQKGKRWRHVA